MGGEGEAIGVVLHQKGNIPSLSALIYPDIFLVGCCGHGPLDVLGTASKKAHFLKKLKQFP